MVPLVCTCQTYARFFPHFGHSCLTVGIVLSFCSFFPIITMSSWGPCSTALVGTDTLLTACSSYSHLEHDRTALELSFFSGANLIPQLGQNFTSIHYSIYTRECRLFFLFPKFHQKIDILLLFSFFLLISLYLFVLFKSLCFVFLVFLAMFYFSVSKKKSRIIKILLYLNFIFW